MAKLVCPICGVYTSPVPSSFRAKVFRRTRTLDLEDAIMTDEGEAQAITTSEAGKSTYGIMVCQACGNRFVTELKGSEWTAVYPIPHRPVAREIPDPIKSEFEEAHLCFAVGAYRGCLLMCRTTLIALQREQKISNLKDLKDKGTISDLLYRQADQVRLWANMVGHDDVPEDITKEDSEQLLTYLEALLDDVYVKPAHLSALQQKFEHLKKGTKT